MANNFTTTTTVPEIPEQQWSFTQKATIAILPKIASSLSIFGSSYIIHQSLSSITKQTDIVKRIRYRLLIMLSVCDLISSFGYFVSTWAIPKEMGQDFVVFNVGNQATCDAQGSMIHFGSISAALYNTFLSIYFYICVREGSRNFRVIEKAEPLFHIISIGFPLGTAIYGVSGGYFNAISIGCFISEYPQGCVGDECIRGEKAQRVRVFGMLLPLAICIVVITVSMVLLYRTVKRQEEATTAYTRRWSTRPSTIRSQRRRPSVLTTQSHSVSVYKQAKLYVGAFAIVWIPPSFQLVAIKFFIDDPSIRFYTRLFTVIFWPAQGFFNMLIYIRYNPVQRLFRMITSSATRLSKMWSRGQQSVTMDESDEGSELE